MIRSLSDWIGHKNFFIFCALAVLLSAGGWATTFLIPPDQLTAYDYHEARRFGLGAVAMVKRVSPNAGEEFVFHKAYDAVIQSRLWQTRGEVQDTVAKYFWISVGLLGLSYWRNPENTRYLNVLSSARNTKGQINSRPFP